MTTADPGHVLTVTFEPGSGPMLRFECTAPAGSPCRKAYACAVAGECEEYHSSTCRPEDRNLVDVDECIVSPWLDDWYVLAESISGTIRLPVHAEWEGESFGLILAGPGELVEEATT